VGSVLLAASWMCKMKTLLCSVTLFLSLLLAVRAPNAIAASILTSLTVAETTVSSASPTDPDLELPTPVPTGSPAPRSVPLASASPSGSVEQRLDSLESKMDELIDRTSSSQTADIVDVIHKLVMIVAIGFSGVWGYWLFVQNRQRYPHASVTHRITHLPICSGKLLLHVTETIRNEGNILLSLEVIQTRVQRVLPLPDDLLLSIQGGTPLLAEGERQYLWPLIGLHECKWAKDECEVEPNESTDIHHDFLIDGGVQVVEVYTYVKNVVKRNREIGWDLKTVYDLRDAQVPCEEKGRNDEKTPLWSESARADAASG
jgi:hypothetical protein